MTENKQVTELLAEANARVQQVRDLIAKGDEITAEERETVVKLTAEARELKQRAETYDEVFKLAHELDAVKAQGDVPVTAYKSLGEFALSVWAMSTGRAYDPRLEYYAWRDPGEPGGRIKAVPGMARDGWKAAWAQAPEHKDLVENVGASGGFLVPVEQQTALLQVTGPAAIVRPRATIVPMRRRQIQWPALDHTNSTAGQPAWYGGVVASWVEEAATKSETEPDFRQLTLVASKLVCYTEASDELLDDSAVGLEALLTQLYAGAISWYEEQAFMQGTGVGQPLGVINAGATYPQGRATAGAIGIVDIINMLMHFHGRNPCWVISQSAMAQILQLNGPAGNASYVFIPNAAQGAPATLFGYPVFWSEHAPLLGGRGDIGLYDFSMYLVGNRQGSTIAASKEFKFQDDLTSWRAVHRVDGQPWLSQPIYLADGTTQVSPFVVLDAATGS